LKFLFCNHEIEPLEYYFNLFLLQKVAPNIELDHKMMQRLGELYPRQSQNFTFNYINQVMIGKEIFIFGTFLQGLDSVQKEYINNWKERLVQLRN